MHCSKVIFFSDFISRKFEVSVHKLCMVYTIILIQYSSPF